MSTKEDHGDAGLPTPQRQGMPLRTPGRTEGGWEGERTRPYPGEPGKGPTITDEEDFGLDPGSRHGLTPDVPD